MRSKKKEEYNYSDNDYNVMNELGMQRRIAMGEVVLQCPFCHGDINVISLSSTVEKIIIGPNRTTIDFEGKCSKCGSNIRVTKR